MSAPARCCTHRSLDHVYRSGQPRPGAACTVPGCSCTGWVPRGVAGVSAPVEQTAKVVALRREGLRAIDIQERLGVSAGFIRKTLREAGL